jgi:hypothetical protein
MTNGRLLPVINHQNINACLKEIGALCGIKKKPLRLSGAGILF